MGTEGLQPDNIFDSRYKIKRHLGSGGTALLYEAVDTHLNTAVALKVFRTDTDPPFTQKRIDREATIQGSLNHHNILALHRHGNTDDTAYLDLELAQSDFEARLKQLKFGTLLPIDEAVMVIANAADALNHTHQQGFLHRDLKPSSLLYAKDGSVKVGDWGSAIPIPTDQSELTKEDRRYWAMSPSYAAPEQRSESKPLSIQTDIYVLGGLTAHSLLTGVIRNPRTPRLFPFKEVVISLRNAMNPIYEAVEEPIITALSLDPSARQASMAEYRAELIDAYERGNSQHRKHRTHIGPRSRRRSRR